jgi:type I restriction enzyme M protein
MSEEQKKQLEQQLWNIANTLRGKMDADQFRDYILGFIFFKYLSEKIHIYADELLKEDGLKYDQVNESTDEGRLYIDAIKQAALNKLGYFLLPSELFHVIAAKGKAKGTDNEDDNQDTRPSNFILEELAAVLKHIEQSTMGTASEDDFGNLFEDLDLTSTKLGKTEKEKNTVIAKVLGHLDNIDFNLSDAKADVLGDAYEYLIGQFASGAGKKAGEFYTPQEVSKILAKLVTSRTKKLKSVYDPTCGSGSLLLRVAKEAEVANFFGQELNRTTYNLARMNMILHDVHYTRFDIKQDDTLEKAWHIDERFEAIVANPPFSAQWSANPIHLGDDRFSQYGRLAPASKADYAFVQHMVHHLADNGIMAIVLPHGVLFRGGAEGHIRQYLIQDRNWLDAVIGLPANIFYGTSIPTCILVFKKCRENDGDILFIDASQGFEKNKNQNRLRDEDIERIITTYRERKPIERYSHVAPLSQVKENDYNLNIPRYVDTFEEEDKIDLSVVSLQLHNLEADMKKTDAEIAAFCKELSISTPF